MNTYSTAEKLTQGLYMKEQQKYLLTPMFFPCLIVVQQNIVDLCSIVYLKLIQFVITIMKFCNGQIIYSWNGRLQITKWNKYQRYFSKKTHVCMIKLNKVTIQSSSSSSWDMAPVSVHPYFSQIFNKSARWWVKKIKLNKVNIHSSSSSSSSDIQSVILYMFELTAWSRSQN